MESFALLKEEPPARVTTDEAARSLLEHAVVVSEDEIRNAVKEAHAARAGVLSILMLGDHVNLEGVQTVCRLDSALISQPPGVSCYAIVTKFDEPFQFVTGSKGRATLGQNENIVAKLEPRQTSRLLSAHEARLKQAA